MLVAMVHPILPATAARLAARRCRLAMLAGSCSGGSAGCSTAALITGLRVVPFIITLGSLKVYRGLAKWLASSTTVYIPGDAEAWWFGRILATEPEPRWLLVAPGVWVLLVLSVLLASTLRYSLLGRYIYAIGSNEATARLCGINVPLVKIVVYSLAGWPRAWPGCFSSSIWTPRGPDHGRRPGAASHRRRRDRRRQPERRRGDRARHPDRLPDHVGAEQRLRPRRHPQRQPGHHHRHHHRRRRHSRPVPAPRGLREESPGPDRGPRELPRTEHENAPSLVLATRSRDRSVVKLRLTQFRHPK